MKSYRESRMNPQQIWIHMFAFQLPGADIEGTEGTTVLTFENHVKFSLFLGLYQALEHLSI